MPKTIFDAIESYDADAFQSMVTANPAVLETVDEDTEETVLEAIESKKETITSILADNQKKHPETSYQVQTSRARLEKINTILAIATGSRSDDETTRASDEDSDNGFEEVAKSQPKANHLFFEWVKKEQELEALKEEHNQRKQTNF